jgi:hypothetical protein
MDEYIDDRGYLERIVKESVEKTRFLNIFG